MFPTNSASMSEATTPASAIASAAAHVHSSRVVMLSNDGVSVTRPRSDMPTPMMSTRRASFFARE
jgi:hypothetical protein